jgi:hypothetical protein
MVIGTGIHLVHLKNMTPAKREKKSVEISEFLDEVEKVLAKLDLP